MDKDKDDNNGIFTLYKGDLFINPINGKMCQYIGKDKYITEDSVINVSFKGNGKAASDYNGD